MRPLVEIINVDINYKGISCLENINLTIYPGDKIALTGKSGAGKSTLIKVANGSLLPSKGKVKWCGKDINKLTRRKSSEIATFWQELNLLNELSVGQNINVGQLGRKSLLWSIRNLMDTLNEDLIFSCMKATDLQKDLIHKNLNDISIGQKQRVAFCRLLIQQGSFNLLDEPFNNLDPKLVKIILDIINKKIQVNNIEVADTYLVSLHKPELINCFTKIIGIRDKKVVINKEVKDLDTNELNSLYK